MSFRIVRKIPVKPMIVCPVGSILPASITIPVITEGTFVEKITANAAETIAIVMLTTEELINLVEKPHLFGIDVVALVGVPGGRYDAVWASFVAPLRRVSLETLDAEIQKIEQAATPDPVSKPRSIVDALAPPDIRANNDDEPSSSPTREEGDFA